MLDDRESPKVGEIVICNRDTKGKFVPIKEFTGKAIIAIGGGGDKTYIVEETDKISSEVRSIQTRENFNLHKELKDHLNTNSGADEEQMHVEEKYQHSMGDELQNFDGASMKKENFQNEGIQPSNSSSSKGNKSKPDHEMNIDILDEENLSKDESMIASRNMYEGDRNSQTEFNQRGNQIVQILKGKYQLLKLVSDGKVYASGEAYFGTVGLGGSASSEVPRLIPNLANIKIKQIACGTNHSLALSTTGDLYTWGMGWEGQLGLNSKYKVVSSPKYIKYFFKNPIKFIACGNNYSFCITEKESHLYGWGENKLGQLGLGKIQVIDKPSIIMYEEEMPSTKQIFDYDKLPEKPVSSKVNKKPLRAEFVNAGFSHTAVISTEGPLYTFGLNIYGQLGLGHTSTTFEPKRVTKDENDNPLKKVIKVACNVTGTFIIVEGGELYTCGSGDIGHGEIGVVKLPKKLHDNRSFDEIFCNSNSVVCFCPLKIISVNPKFGPSTGNTILSIIGSALKEFPKLSVRFSFDKNPKEIKANYDDKEKTIFVTTPNFIELCPSIMSPARCQISVTFDGNYFTPYDEDYLIYSNNKIKPISLNPKCGPIEGGSTLSIQIDLTGIETSYLFLLTVGFQAKPQMADGTEKRKIKMKQGKTSKNDSENSRVSSKLSGEEKSNTHLTVGQENKEGPSKDIIDLNPLDINPNNPYIDKGTLFCTKGTYENGQIVCEIPKISNFNQSVYEYNVDVSLNGQQFSGFPLIYRFYGKHQ